MMYYVATTDYSLMRRDAKRVAEWDIKRIIPCHGDVIDKEGNEAWNTVYQWFLNGSPQPTLFRQVADPFMKLARWAFLM
jgi:hypothetical protein